VPDEVREKATYIICTRPESSPWIQVGKIRCVIDSGLCQLPVYDPDTDTVMFGHCISPSAVRLQRPGILIDVTALPGERLRAFAEIQRCDPGRGSFILAALQLNFPGVSLSNFPSRDVLLLVHSSLVDFGALAGKGRLTEPRIAG
jgi:hypothetical protein